MSDTTNRDIGRKREYQRVHKKSCGCWHCLPGKEKRYILRDKEERKQVVTEPMVEPEIHE